jgi:hypothetical protein
MPARKSDAQRALRIVIRTIHIGCIAMLLGAVTFGGDFGTWAHLAVFTGGLLMVEEVHRYGLGWFRWVQAWVVMGKMTALVIGVMVPSLLLTALWVCLALGGLISHAPGRLRQHPLWGSPGPCALPKNDYNPAK